MSAGHDALLSAMLASPPVRGIGEGRYEVWPARPLGTGARAVFLDRDGTLIEDTGYLAAPEEVRLLPGVTASLARLRGAGFRLVVVSNQSGVARGRFGVEALAAVHQRLAELLAAEDVHLDGALYCTHGPDDGCPCRKPRPGMLLSAAARLGVELSSSWMRGATPSDVEAGRAAGCRAALIEGAGFAEAAAAILGEGGGRRAAGALA